MPHLRANLWQSTYPNRLSASKLDVEKLDVEKLSIFRLLVQLKYDRVATEEIFNTEKFRIFQ